MFRAHVRFACFAVCDLNQTCPDRPGCGRLSLCVVSSVIHSLPSWHIFRQSLPVLGFKFGVSWVSSTIPSQHIITLSRGTSCAGVACRPSAIHFSMRSLEFFRQLMHLAPSVLVFSHSAFLRAWHQRFPVSNHVKVIADLSTITRTLWSLLPSTLSPPRL